MAVNSLGREVSRSWQRSQTTKGPRLAWLALTGQQGSSFSLPGALTAAWCHLGHPPIADDPVIVPFAAQRETPSAFQISPRRSARGAA